MQKIRNIMLVLLFATLLYLEFQILENKLFSKDLWQAIQDSSLELSLTFLLVLVLLWWGIEINHRVVHKRRFLNNVNNGLPGSGLLLSQQKPEENLQTDFWQGVSTEMIGAVISTILLGMVVLVFNQYQSIQNRKQELILQMGSDERVWAIESVRQLDSLGWLQDGTLMRFYSRGANLSEAFLWKANLSRASLHEVNLSDAVLQDANLHLALLWDVDLTGASLYRADLTDTSLWRTNLAGANLSEANLMDASLWRVNLTNVLLEGARFDDKIVLPDGEPIVDGSGQYVFDDKEGYIFTPESYWNSDTDMTRYTNPEHTDYWHPCMEINFNSRPWYCD